MTDVIITAFDGIEVRFATNPRPPERVNLQIFCYEESSVKERDPRCDGHVVQVR